MTGRISGEARGAVIRAQQQARRLGQQFIGCEHLLYGVAGAEDAAGTVLRRRGVTPERIEEHVTLLIRQSRTTAAHQAPLDGRALSAIGIDLNAVRERAEEAFGPGALDAAAFPRRARGGHLRVTRQARKCIDRSIRQAEAQPTDQYNTEYLTLNLLTMDASVQRSILAALGVSAPQLAAEIKKAL